MRRIFGSEGQAPFVTFSCDRRCKLLDDGRCKGIVIDTTGAELAKRKGDPIGFVIMPDHVHALVGFLRPGQLSEFMQVWKQRSSVQIKRVVETQLQHPGRTIPVDEAVWQSRDDALNVFSGRSCIKNLRTCTRSR